MIREVVREAWASSPAQLVAAVLATPVVVVVAWFLVVLVLVAAEPAR